MGCLPYAGTGICSGERKGEREERKHLCIRNREKRRMKTDEIHTENEKSRKNKTIVTRERKERVAYNVYKSKNDDGGYLPNDITMKQTRVGRFL